MTVHPAYVVPARMAVVVDEAGESARVFLMSLPDGPPVVLSHTSALIWLLATDGEVDVVAAVSAIVGQSPELIGADVRRHLDELVGRALLTVRE